MDKLSSEGYKSTEEKIWGTDKPYYHVGDPGLFRKYRLHFYRLIAPINPFAKKQVLKADEISFLPFYGRNFYNVPALPNPVGVNQLYPFHFDPTKQENQFMDEGPRKTNNFADEAEVNFE